MDQEPPPIVFDISSDDDSYGRIDDPKGDDLAWLAEFLGVSGGGDDKLSDDDSDDVVVVREVRAPAKLASLKPGVTTEGSSGGDDEDDDDCVVLDGDPDKPVADDSDPKEDSDELLIVAEKGQIACRDFPHSRHLCASFPFSTTPHENHCNLCHCYVCDQPAPCVLWVTTSSVNDHCHATDKEDTWITQRTNLKSGKHAPLKPVPKLPEASMPVGLLPQHHQVSTQHHQVLPHNAVRLPAISRLPNHVPRMAAPLQGCSSTNFSTPTILSRIRNPHFGVNSPKFRFQPPVVTGPQFRSGSNNIQVVRGSQSTGNLGGRFAPPPPNPVSFKRPGIVRFPRPANAGVSAAMNQFTHNRPNFRSPAIPVQHHRNLTPVPVPKHLNPPRWENVNMSAHQSLYVPNLGSTALTSPQQFVTQPIPLVPPSAANSQSFFRPENQFQNPSISPRGNETRQNPSIYDVQGAGARTLDPAAYDPSWVSNALVSTGQSQNQQQPPPPLVDPFQPIEPSANSALGGIANWLLENPSEPAVADGSPVPQSNNIYSPEHASNDILFDFETSWNGLTHA